MDVKQFAAKLQVELTAELVDAGADVLRLHFQIFFIVETKAIDHLCCASSLFSGPAPRLENIRFIRELIYQ